MLSPMSSELGENSSEVAAVEKANVASPRLGWRCKLVEVTARSRAKLLASQIRQWCGGYVSEGDRARNGTAMALQRVGEREDGRGEVE
jgi:hypothetical protein